MPKLAKAALYERLHKRGFKLNAAHRALIDRLIHKGGGFILTEAVIQSAKDLKWTDAMVAELRKALK